MTDTAERVSRRGVFFRLSPLLIALVLWMVLIVSSFDTVTSATMVLPYLMIVALFCASLATLVLCVPSIGRTAATLFLLLIASFYIWLMPTLYDGVTFVIWAPFHASELARAGSSDRVIAHWDGWGFAGMDNDSYLVVDTADRLSTQAGAEAWQSRQKLACQVVFGRRLWPRLYFALTDGCDLISREQG